MKSAPVGLRNVLRRMMTADDEYPPEVESPEEHARRVAGHERRIHNHPCPCGSGKTYGTCCILNPRQEELELRHRRLMRQQEEVSA
jgi:hypothetical protein